MRAVLAIIMGLAAVPALAQQPLGPPGQPASAFPKPARPVASIISDRWASEDQRERAGEAARVLAFLDVRPGMTVADIGAGAGYYVMQLAARVGPTGRVLAQDVVPAYLAALQRRVTAARLTNVAIGLGEAHDPRLPPQSIDLAIMVHMYHEIEQPFGLLINLRAALRPGARVGIVDTTRPTVQHGTPPALLDCELAAAGYRRVGTLPMEAGAAYLAVFEPTGSTPTPEAARTCTP